MLPDFCPAAPFFQQTSPNHSKTPKPTDQHENNSCDSRQSPSGPQTLLFGLLFVCLGRASRVKNAPTCYRAPRWPHPEFPRKMPKKYPPARNSGTPRKYPQKYQKNTKNAHFWYFGGIFSVFSGYFRGKVWESRISGRGVFFRYFSWKFRVGPSRGSVAGRAVLNSRGQNIQRAKPGEDRSLNPVFGVPRKAWV